MTQRDFGTVQHNGQTLTLTQDAYRDNYGTDGGVRYYAHAKDAAGNLYLVAWDTTAEWDAADQSDAIDEADACDWTDPAAVELIEEAEEA